MLAVNETKIAIAQAILNITADNSYGLAHATGQYTAKNLTSFGSYELIKTQIASIFGKKPCVGLKIGF